MTNANTEVNIFIYFNNISGITLDEIEEIIEKEFSNNVIVCGSGVGNNGINIDLEVLHNEDPIKLSENIRAKLSTGGITPSKIQIWINGENRTLGMAPNK